jgi:hypothetical protein
LKAEAAPDDGGSRERTRFIFFEPLEAAGDDQANVFRNVDFAYLYVSAEFAGVVEYFSIFKEKG